MPNEFISQSLSTLTNTPLNIQKKLLPITKYRNQLLYAVEQNQITIVLGHTGCGKTTQIPQFLYEAGWASQNGIIGCTQPRRLVAKSVSERVSLELNSPPGSLCGYSIQFDHNVSEKTKIKYMTDGILLNEIFFDPLLERYSIVILDEVHERTLSTDLLLGVLKRILEKRNDFRLVLSSASVDANKLSQFFGQDKVCTMSIEGKLFPVETLFLQKPTENYVDSAIETVININSTYPPGDILVFLSGRKEIEYCIKKIEDSLIHASEDCQTLVPLPLHAGLTVDEQMRVFNIYDGDFRKVIFSTNIAETSITIDGIVYVVDSGFNKQRIYNPYTRTSKLINVPISKSSAIQRSGRAGRTMRGKVFRLYTEKAYSLMKEEFEADILNCDMSPLVLFLKGLGLKNILQFPFFVRPPTVHLMAALEVCEFYYSRQTTNFFEGPLSFRCLGRKWKFDRPTWHTNFQLILGCKHLQSFTYFQPIWLHS